MYYFGARYYDPRTSVWQSADPILEKYLDGKHNGGVYVSAHLGMFGYVMNNPLKYFDPDGEAEVKFINGAHASDISEYSKQIVSDLGDKAGLSTVYVTSTKRSPREQAEAMYGNLKNQRTAGNLYRKGAGREVENIYRERIKAGDDKNEVISEMVKKINEVGPEKISKHMGDFSDTNTLDISNARIPKNKRGDFKNAVKADGRVNKYLYPPRDPAHHIEIRQPKPKADE